jgi:prefoldin subunit 5
MTNKKNIHQIKEEVNELVKYYENQIQIVESNLLQVESMRDEALDALTDLENNGSNAEDHGDIKVDTNNFLLDNEIIDGVTPQ